MESADDASIIAEYANRYPALLNSEMASEILGIKMATLYDRSSRGDFDAMKVKSGGKLLFRRDLLLRAILSGDLDRRQSLL